VYAIKEKPYKYNSIRVLYTKMNQIIWATSQPKHPLDNFDAPLKGAQK